MVGLSWSFRAAALLSITPGHFDPAARLRPEVSARTRRLLGTVLEAVADPASASLRGSLVPRFCFCRSDRAARTSLAYRVSPHSSTVCRKRLDVGRLFRKGRVRARDGGPLVSYEPVPLTSQRALTTPTEGWSVTDARANSQVTGSLSTPLAALPSRGFRAETPQT